MPRLGTYLKTFPGGSHSITVLMQDKNGQKFVRKMAPLGESSKIKYQAKWMKKYGEFRQIPTVYGIEEKTDVVSYDFQYFDRAVSFLEFIENTSLAESQKLLVKIIKFVESRIHSNKKKQINEECVRKYIKEKVFKKIEECSRELPYYERLLHEETLIVNGEVLLNIKPAIEKLLNETSIIEKQISLKQCDIHGDLTIENILICDHNFVLLDPNNENIISDVAVEFGKLFQSLHSLYEYFETIHEIKTRGRSINVSWIKSREFQSLYLILRKYILRKYGSDILILTYFHEAIHFTRLLPYKARKNPDLFIAYFARSVILFNELLKSLKTKAVVSD